MIQVSVNINATLEKVWEFWNNPIHIQNWYFASNEWHCPKALNNLVIGEKFNIRMQTKDGSFGFDYEGKYTNIIDFQIIEYILDDDRKVITTFEKLENSVLITQKFDAETENSFELQQNGWQLILENFKKCVEQI